MNRSTLWVALAVLVGLVSVLATAVGRGRETLRRSGSAAESPRLQGVVVERVDPGTALEKAGILTGDVLTSWESLAEAAENSESRRGRIASPFDWSRVETEEAPRGTIRLAGKRRGKPVVLTVESGLWGGSVRPVMPGETQQSYLRFAATQE